jgi:hypothetical protein
MTANEKKRMLGMVRTVECYFSENLALKAVLTSHRIPTPVWQEECDKLMDDPEHSPEVHVKFQHLYNEIERSRDGTKAFEAFLEALPGPKKHWN